MQLWPRYILVDDEVWGEAEHAAVALLVRPPAETEGHEEEPGALQQRHLVVQVQVTEACEGQIEHVRHVTEKGTSCLLVSRVINIQ